MELALFWIDAFTNRPFAGNPAAVVPLESWPGDDLLQSIARQNGLSETVYFVRKGPGRYHLRWFTPAVEVELCGHATLASAHVLFHELGEKGTSVEFETLSGVLTVSRKADLLEMDFPAIPTGPAEAPRDLIFGLGAPPEQVLATPRAWFCVYPDAMDVAALRPNQALISRISPARIIVTAPGKDCDFVSRFFAPDVGIPEDPVTGSAHCALAPFWARRLGKTALHARQLSARTGELWCELKGDRVRIAGKSALYLKGRIFV